MDFNPCSAYCAKMRYQNIHLRRLRDNRRSVLLEYDITGSRDHGVADE